MDKQSRQKRKKLVSQLSCENIAVFSGKRFASVIFLVWTITRILQISAELLCAVQGILIIYSWHNTLMLVVIGLFLAALYMGFRWMVIFPVFMGMMLVMETFAMDLYSILNPSCLLGARLYAITMIVAAYAQVVCPIVLLVNKNTKLYFDSVREITQWIVEEERRGKRERRENLSQNPK